jgi:dTDP-4-dehydrorhamnose reductase
LSGILVLGAGGMLGSAVCKELDAQQKEYVGLTRRDCDITVPWDLGRVKRYYNPTIVFNCAGAPNSAGPVNSLGPWYVARVFDYARIVHVSTDCVFGNGEERADPWPVGRLPEPESLYGAAKLAGEQGGGHVVNVRTSFIGPQHGLLRWLLDQVSAGATEVPGWPNAWWSGSSVYEVAEVLVLIGAHYMRTGVQHVATASPISKHDLLVCLVEALGLPLKVTPNPEIRINRVLVPTVELAGLRDAQVMAELVRHVGSKVAA